MKKLFTIVLALAVAASLLCGGVLASGEPGGQAPNASGVQAITADSSDTETVTLQLKELDELIIGPEGYTFDSDIRCGRVEVDPAAELVSQYPIIVFFDESDSVENGQVIGNVQFVSDYDEVIAVVHTNDVHGHIDVEPYVKGYADSLKASGDYSLVLTVSAGDIYGGGEAVAGSYNGELIPAIMDPVYDVIAPGNNDFGSTGVARQNILLASLYEHTQTLCANVETQDTGLALAEYAESYEPVIGVELFDELYEKAVTAGDGTIDLTALGLEDLAPDSPAYPHTTTFVTDEGTVVGVFGLTTSGGALAVELDSLSSTTMAQQSVDELLAEGAQVIFGVGHTGWLGEGASGGNSNDTNSWALANTIKGMDAFVDGHTHSIINYGQGVLVGDDHCYVNQAESFGYCIGTMLLYVKDGEVIAVNGQVDKDMSDIVPDEQVQAVVDLAQAKVKDDFGKPVAETPYFLNAERMSSANEGGTVRGNETNLGDFMTDVIRAACSEKMGVDYDFAAYPGYWLRSSIEAGEITLESIQGVFANPTVLYYDTYTASQILSMVQRGLNSVAPGKEDTTFNQYSGIRVTYTYSDGAGTPVTIEVGDTLVYDAANGGIQVDDSWTCEGVVTMTGGEIDSYTGDMADWICHDKTEVQNMVADWLAEHTADDYTILPNEVAPDGRIVEVG